MDTQSFHRSASLLRLLTVFLANSAGFAGAGTPSVTLKDAYHGHFKIGTAINRAVATGQAWRRNQEQVNGDVELVKAQFNQVVAENEMKWMSLHPRPGKGGYNWTAADAFVEFGVNNNMELAGHTLVWHSQTPNWVFEGTHVPPGGGKEPQPAGAENKADAPQSAPPPPPSRHQPDHPAPDLAQEDEDPAASVVFVPSISMGRARPVKNCSKECGSTSTLSWGATRAGSRYGTS